MLMKGRLGWTAGESPQPQSKILLLLDREVLVLEEHDSAVRYETRYIADQLVRVARCKPVGELYCIGRERRPHMQSLIDKTMWLERGEAGEGRGDHDGRL